MSRGYIVFPGNMKPHVIAAMFNVGTPINGAEQGLFLRMKVIVDRRVVLHHIVAK